MEKIAYEELLKTAPDHMSDDFIVFLRENNTVVYESEDWIIIENYKYHTNEKSWWTAFIKGDRNWRYEIDEIEQFKLFDILIKSPSRRTVKRFHVHLIEQQGDN